MKQPNTLCDSCKEKDICRSCSNELLSADDIDHLASNGIKAKVIVYGCRLYQPSIFKTSTSVGEQTKKVFNSIDNIRGYRPPKRRAEAASIIRMLKQYTPTQIIETYQRLKQDKFWQDKELYMMSVESQIGAVLKNGTHRHNPRTIKSPEEYTDPNVLRHS